MYQYKNPVRDYRSVEKNDATKILMPSGMRPVYGLHTYGMQRMGKRHFLPSGSFLQNVLKINYFLIFKQLQCLN